MRALCVRPLSSFFDCFSNCIRMARNVFGSYRNRLSKCHSHTYLMNSANAHYLRNVQEPMPFFFRNKINFESHRFQLKWIWHCFTNDKQKVLVAISIQLADDSIENERIGIVVVVYWWCVFRLLARFRLQKYSLAYWLWCLPFSVCRFLSVCQTAC